VSAAFNTLQDFTSGREVLRSLLAAAYGSPAQAVASLALFSHPDTVDQTECKAAVPVIRGAIADRGKIGERHGRQVGFDDNTAPTNVFDWINGRTERPADIQYNHVYDDSGNPDTYTCLANLCVTPSFLAKLTDHDPEIRALLRYRVWDIYHWHPAHEPEPVKPVGYDDLVWAPFLPAVPDAKAAFHARVARCGGSRTAKFITVLGAFGVAAVLAASAAKARDREETCTSHTSMSVTTTTDCRRPEHKPTHCTSYTNINGTTKTECR
jgi:hypothetical protein